MTESAASLVDIVARFMRDVPALHSAEKRVTFDPVQMTFLQKLVRESALQGGITIRKEDFFKGLVYADAFTEIVAGRATLWEDLRVLVAELEKIHPYLDVDLNLLVRYTGIYIERDLRGSTFFKPASLNQLARKHAATNAAVAANGGAPDVFDRAVAHFTLDLVTREETRALLAAARGRGDARGALACDAILTTLPADRFASSAAT